MSIFSYVRKLNKCTCLLFMQFLITNRDISPFVVLADVVAFMFAFSVVVVAVGFAVYAVLVIPACNCAVLLIGFIFGVVLWDILLYFLIPSSPGQVWPVEVTCIIVRSHLVIIKTKSECWPWKVYIINALRLLINNYWWLKTDVVWFLRLGFWAWENIDWTFVHYKSQTSNKFIPRRYNVDE